MANKVELILSNSEGIDISLDIDDSFEYRLNRNVLTFDGDKMKTLGGTYSTEIKLLKTKKNKKFFRAKGNLKSINKFYDINNYQGVLYQNGVEIIRGNFRIAEISSDGYSGEFFDEDISWVDKLNDIKLNELGYVDGKPTWLQPFDGASSFNDVNNKSNDETNYICPTLIYNNSPVTDFFDFTDADIWGSFEMPLGNPPLQISSSKDFPDSFKAVTGLFSSRLGMTFEDFPPAMYYRNVLEKCFEEIGMTINSALFEEPWFNALYMTYSGESFPYNWKNIASVYSITDGILIHDELYYDKIVELNVDEMQVNVLALQTVNIFPDPSLPPAEQDYQKRNWIEDEKFRFAVSNIIKHDNPNDIRTVDKIVAYNKFGVEGQYICPTGGIYTFNVRSAYRNFLDNRFLLETGANIPIWYGNNLIDSFGTWDLDSFDPNFPGVLMPTQDRRFAWDDNVLVIKRYNKGGSEVYENTDSLMYNFMNGASKDFSTDPSDIIAYFSPKRQQLYDGGDIMPIEFIHGSPLTNFESDVKINSYSHRILKDSYINGKESESTADITVSLDLKKNERVVIYWTSITNINAIPRYNTPTRDRADAYFSYDNEVELYSTNDEFFEVKFECGEYDLDLAASLPSVSAKDFVSSFINQFDLRFSILNDVVTFEKSKSYYSDESYDITSRVVENNWSSKPMTSTPSKLIIGYANDDGDRLLNGFKSNCMEDESYSLEYGNVSFENDNVYSTKTLKTLNLFSTTKFYEGKYEASLFATGVIDLPTTIDPVSNIILYKGISVIFAASKEFPYYFPSLQSYDSFNMKTVGDLEYIFSQKVRLLYHLGTLNNYIGYSDDFQCLIDSPRADANFIKKSKHWYMPTASAFDKENNNPYPTLRYDGVNGLHDRFFEDTLDMYNKAEIITIKAVLRNVDWINLTGSKKIIYQENLYILSKIIDYDPTENNICQLVLIKDV